MSEETSDPTAVAEPVVTGEPAPVVQSVAAARGPLALEAIGLNKDFRLSRTQTLHAVQDVSLSLYKGGVVALVGESGSGKSTVARMLAGQERPTSGSVIFNGKPVDLKSRSAFRAYKSEVQYVFQDPFSSLNPVHNVGYHLARPVRLHQGRSVDLDREVMVLLEQVRLTPAAQFEPKYPHELSGGQRQRVGLARSLIARPQLLVADEPTSALDVSVQAAILNQLADLQREFGFSCLFISHDLAVVRYLCDRIAVMSQGEIVEAGPRDQVFLAPSHPYTRDLLAATEISRG